MTAGPGRVAAAKRLRDLLLHRRLVVRFTVLLGMGVVVFITCWMVAYLWLPEGLLRGRSIGAALAAGSIRRPFAVEWLGILAVNLPVLLVYVAANLMQFRNGIPLGYLPVVTMQGYFGIVTGTNSFSLPYGEGKIPPSRSVGPPCAPRRLVRYGRGIPPRVSAAAG